MRDWEEKDFFKNTFKKSPHTDTPITPFELVAEAKSVEACRVVRLAKRKRRSSSLPSVPEHKRSGGNSSAGRLSAIRLVSIIYSRLSKNLFADRQGDYKSGIEEGWVMHIAHPLWGYLTLRIPHFGYMLKERAFTAETPLTKAVLDELADEIMAAIYEGPDALDNEWEPTMPGDGDTSGLWEAMSDWTFYSNECRQALAEWLWAELPKMLFAYPTTQSGADDDESSM
jgi:hypothetical protein